MKQTFLRPHDFKKKILRLIYFRLVFHRINDRFRCLHLRFFNWSAELNNKNISFISLNINERFLKRAKNTLLWAVQLHAMSLAFTKQSMPTKGSPSWDKKFTDYHHVISIDVLTSYTTLGYQIDSFMQILKDYRLTISTTSSFLSSMHLLDFYILETTTFFFRKPPDFHNKLNFNCMQCRKLSWLISHVWSLDFY